MKSMLSLVFFIITLLTVVSCTSTREPNYKARVPQSDESNVPWNRPQSGEGAGVLGGLLNRG